MEDKTSESRPFYAWPFSFATRPFCSAKPADRVRHLQLGIVLCADTDEDIARYSVLHGNEQMFMSKYKLYLPTEEELRNEIETQKMKYYLQHKEAESEMKADQPSESED